LIAGRALGQVPEPARGRCRIAVRPTINQILEDS
jgi:hypothetical protein